MTSNYLYNLGGNGSGSTKINLVITEGTKFTLDYESCWMGYKEPVILKLTGSCVNTGNYSLFIVEEENGQPCSSIKYCIELVKLSQLCDFDLPHNEHAAMVMGGCSVNVIDKDHGYRFDTLLCVTLEKENPKSLQGVYKMIQI